HGSAGSQNSQSGEGHGNADSRFGPRENYRDPHAGRVRAIGRGGHGACRRADHSGHPLATERKERAPDGGDIRDPLVEGALRAGRPRSLRRETLEDQREQVRLHLRGGQIRDRVQQVASASHWPSSLTRAATGNTWIAAILSAQAALQWSRAIATPTSFALSAINVSNTRSTLPNSASPCASPRSTAGASPTRTVPPGSHAELAWRAWSHARSSIRRSWTRHSLGH